MIEVWVGVNKAAGDEEEIEVFLRQEDAIAWLYKHLPYDCDIDGDDDYWYVYPVKDKSGGDGEKSAVAFIICKDVVY